MYQLTLRLWGGCREVAGTDIVTGCVVTEKGVAERKEGESAIDVAQVC